MFLRFDETFEMNELIEKEREKNLHRKRIEAKKRKKQEDKFMYGKKGGFKKKNKRWDDYDDDE